jgi:Mg-chelatase subunit ChlD
VNDLQSYLPNKWKGVEYFYLLLTLVITLFSGNVAMAEEAKYTVKLLPLAAEPVADTKTQVSGTFKLSKDGSPMRDLEASEFTVYEDSTLEITDSCEIRSPESEGMRMADFVFVLDITGSMGSHINAVKNNIETFATQLAGSGIDYRLSMITFRDDVIVNGPKNPSKGVWTNDANVFKSWVRSVSVNGGADGPEASFDAVGRAVDFSVRDSAQRIIVLFTDAASHVKGDSGAGTDPRGVSFIYDQNSLIAKLKSNGFVVYVAGPSNAQFRGKGSPTEETGGRWYAIHADISSILKDIREDISNQYAFNCQSGASPGKHTLEISPAKLGYEDYRSNSQEFIVGAAPEVKLTGETRTLVNEGVHSEDTEIPISVVVSDAAEPFTKAVTLYYRHAKASGEADAYASVAMTTEDGSIYMATIPDTVVLNPAVEFYVMATDGERRGFSPKMDAVSKPWQIAIINHPPEIGKCTPEQYNVEQPVSVSANISDSDDDPVSATLFYRVRGSLTDYISLSMSEVSAGTHSATVPADAATAYGIDGYIIATDGRDGETKAVCSLSPVTIPVEITSVTRQEDTTNTLGPYPVRAIVLSADTVTLHYTVNGAAETTLDMPIAVSAPAERSERSNIYYADIPGQSPDSTVEYWVTASNATSIEEDRFPKDRNYTFKVRPIPEAMSVSPSTQILAAGETAKFLATGCYGAPYDWNSTAGELSTTTGEQTELTATSVAGLYSVRAEDPTGICAATAKVQIVEPLAVKPASANISAGSQMSFLAQGGQAPYTWAISEGPATMAVDSSSTSAEVTASTTDSGSVVLTLTDKMGRTAQAEITLNGPLTLEPSGTLSLALGITQPFSAKGGEPPYTWKAVGGNLNTEEGDTVAYEVPHVGGAYTVTVTDNAGNTDSVLIVAGEPMLVTPLRATIPLDGMTSFIVSGGIPPYRWVASEGTVAPVSGAEVTFTPPPKADIYQLTVTDASGTVLAVEVETTGVSRELTITPAEANLKVSKSQTLTVVGGTEPYSWNATVGELSDTTGRSITYKAPGNIGTVTVTLTDGAGKQATATIRVIDDGPVITPANATVPVNDTVALTVTGGLAPYTWTADVGSVDSSGTQVTYTAPGQAGTATVTVTDAKNTPATATITITDTGMAITPSVTGLEGGQTRDFTATGGDGNYNWTAAKGSLSATTGATVTYTAPNLADGEEDTVTVKDNSGNDTTATVRILSVIPDMAITPAKATVQVGGSQKFVAQNAVGKNVRWTTEGGSISDDGTFTAPASKGTYTITATDYTSGRTAQAEVVVTAEQLILTPKQARVNTSGSESFTVTGGQAPYTWQVAGEGSLDSHNGETVQFTAESTATKVRLMVTDNQGLSSEAEITVIGDMYITPEEVTLPRGGKQQFTAFGGSGTINWTATVGNIDNAGNYTAPQGLGTYDVTAHDASGNKASAEVVVADVPIITPANVWLDQRETATFTVVGGTPPYDWTATAGTFSGSSINISYKAPAVSTEVTITVTDNRGHTSEATAYVDLPLLADVEKFFIEPGQTRPVRVNGGIPSFDWQTNKGLLEKATTEKAGENIYTAPKVMGDDSITIRDRKGNTTTVAVHVIRTLSVSPQKRYMKKNETKTFTVSGGVPPYSADASMGEIEPKQSDDGTFKFTSPGVGDQDVTIKFSDNGGQTVEVHAYVERQLGGTKTLYVDKKATTTFAVNGGTGGYVGEPDAGTVYIDKDGNGTYTAPNRYGEYDIKVIDSSDQEFVIKVVVERQVPVISPLKFTMATGETKTFMVNRGAPDYEWAFEGNTWQGMDSGNSVIQITAPQTAGVYKLTVEDINGNVAKEPAIVTVFQPLLISPTSYPVYKGESVAVRFNKLGGSGACEWILTDLTEITKGPEFLVVRPRTDVELGTTYTVACRDQNGDTAQSKIIVGSLPGDLNGDGVIDDDEAQIAMDKYFNDEESLNGVPMDKNQLFLHIESNLIFN